MPSSATARSRRSTRTTSKELGLAWYFDTDLPRGHEATPIVVDGVIYTTGSWSVVFAIDARTGKLLWRHDPAGAARAGRHRVLRRREPRRRRLSAGASTRRRSTAGSRRSTRRRGEVVWSVHDRRPEHARTRSPAPRVVKGKVIIGNGGAELGVRGYVTAYDAETGAQVWRFYTVPGDPAKRLREARRSREAAKTWDPRRVVEARRRRHGLGLDRLRSRADQLYVGTGNGSPWRRNYRSPGGGDNLFLCSIVALERRHRRVPLALPGDARRGLGLHLHAADDRSPTSTIDGAQRKVLMHAPKNGFFYVHRPRRRASRSRRRSSSTVNWASASIPQPAGRSKSGSALRHRAPCSMPAVAAARTTGTRWPSTRRRASPTCRPRASWPIPSPQSRSTVAGAASGELKPASPCSRAGDAARDRPAGSPGIR